MEAQQPLSGQVLELVVRLKPDVSSQSSTTPQKIITSLPVETLLQIISYLSYLDRFHLKLAGSHALLSVLHLAPQPSFKQYVVGYEKLEGNRPRFAYLPGQFQSGYFTYEDKLRALVLACTVGHNSVVEKLVKEELLHFKRMKVTLHKMLEQAVVSSQPSTVKLLLSLGAKNIDTPIRPRDMYGNQEDVFNALELAALKGDDQMVQLLLDAGASVRFRPWQGQSAISMAARNGHLSTVKLLRNSIQPFEPRKLLSSLFEAASNGHSAIVEYLMDSGAEVTPAVNVPSALHVAARGGHLQCLQAMFDHGATDSLVSYYDSVSRVSRTGWSTLHYAASNGHAEVVKFLLDKKCFALSEDLTQALIPIAAGGGNLEVVKLLLDAGFELGSKIEGETALDFAVASNCLEIISLLLENGAGTNFSAEDQSKSKLLHTAATRGFSEAAALLLAHGFDPNIQNFDGDTPLHVATRKDHHEFVAVLLQAGANPEILNKEKITALRIAVRENCESAASALLIGGASTKRQASKRDSVLHTALFFGRPRIVALLIAHGADLNAVGRFGRQPIMAAAICGNLESVKLLRDAGANMHAISADGKSALHLVAEMENLEVVKLLLECGLDKDAKDKLGQRPLMYVPKNGMALLKDLLQ